MSRTRLLIATTLLTCFGGFTETCEAGPLLDWLRGRPVISRFNAYRPGYYQPNIFRQNAYYRGGIAPGMTQAPGAVVPTTQAPGTCMTTCPKTYYQTVNRVVANYVPYTAFRTEWYRVPVTYYRPTTSTNPQTGCTTTCMRPCTYYQMQARRVPYTTYQTVYRTVQHRVPYTVNETTYGTTGCSSCTSCGVNPGVVQNGGYGVNTNGINAGGLNIGGGYSAPANTVPQLSPGEIKADTTLQKPVPEPEQDPNANLPTQEKTQNSSHQQPGLNVPQNQPPVVDDSNRTASLIRGKWNYSPVRHAGYTVSAGTDSRDPVNRLSGFSSPSSKPNRPAFRSTGWKSTNQ